MANLCSFLMRVRGSMGDIEQFYNAMMQNGTIYMGRGAEASLDWEDDNVAMINGCCKWSVQSAMVDNAISMRTNPDRWYWGDGKSSEGLEFITLFEACKKWNIVMEVYSEECGCEFQEHYICDKGDVICNECVEWHEYDLYDYETKEEAEEDYDTKFTDEEWANKDERVTRGGFENWDFEIQEEMEI